MGQIASLVISTVAFAVLARLLGPDPFAAFAVIVFVFSLLALLLDLSPQGYLLVSGVDRQTRRSAWAVAGITAALCAGVVFVLLLGISGLLDASSSPVAISTTMAAAVLCQFCAQVPRASLLVAGYYARIAAIDVSSMAVSVLAAIAAAAATQSVIVLCLQLLIVALCRCCLYLVSDGLSRRMHAKDFNARDRRLSGVGDAIRYGLRVMPINVASYAGRSLDSGILPFLIPASAAAAYARTYQLVVVPVTQLQLSVGGAIVARLAGAEGHSRRELGRRIWRALLLMAGLSGILIGLFSQLISIVMFGPAWPMVNVFIAAMSCALPSVATTTFFAWQLQIVASAAKSLAQLAAVCVGPLAVILCAILSTQAAVVALVLTGLATPAILLATHGGDVSGGRRSRMLLQVAGAWILPCLIFCVVSTLSGFWTYNNW
ncbi:oligosaccharide flippase family protein [Microbacterium gallinarum]|uniref:Oligosaccharide flippase family protein n=1 Tax=Microbacterium gallinarum TaxID=2762209 RepID=A0ABR8X3G0_9MICO|nr:oligosaccharide flippase family protein [Microbacterium gallinarum]MBD8023743.1 oligosaccharide flippase family protein [Microbacterium gallinarum]